MSSSLRSRLLLLFGCTGAGALAGLLGQYFTGSSAWFLAVPACVIVGWLFVANPTECLPPGERPGNDRSPYR